MEYGDFESFLKRMGQLPYAAMVREARAEAAQAELRRTQTVNGQSYAARIKNFLWFVEERKRPGSATAEDFYAYKPIAAALVASGDFKESVLEVFGRAL